MEDSHEKILERIINHPEDVSLVAFAEDSMQTSDRLVSTARSPVDEMGRKAVDMLWRLMDAGMGSLPSVCLPYGEIDSLRTVGQVGQVEGRL